MSRNGGICERCHRLNKECKPSTSVRKRPSKPNNAALKRSQLEDKLDDLVSILRTQNSVPVNPYIITPASSNPSPQGPTIEPTFDINLTAQNLSDFREHHLPYFPFIYLPPETTPADLQLVKPVLCLAIHTICTKAASKQTVLSRHLRETLASKILANGERSLDLLMSVVVCMTWSAYITHGKPFLGIMSGLARSLVTDLRLGKPLLPTGCPSTGPNFDPKDNQTNEERRALLAVFALSVIIGTTFKHDIMPWSPHIEELCTKLALDEEYEGDLILISITRISRVALNAAEIARQAIDDPEFSKHIILTIKTLEVALDNLKSMLTADQLQHNTVLAFLHNTEVAVYELALLQQSNLNLSPQHPSNYKCITYLASCLETCKACTDCFLMADIAYISMPSMVIFMSCIRVLYKLSTLQEPAWNTSLVCSTVDIVQCLQQAAAAIEQSNDKLKQEIGEDSVLAATAVTMRSIAPNWRIPDQDIALRDSTAVGPWCSADGVDMSMMDFSDDFWLHGTFNF